MNIKFKMNCAWHYLKDAHLKRMPLVSGRWGTGRMALRNKYADIKRFVSKKDPFIVDGGSNVGDTVAAFLWLYPHSRISAFEPLHTCAEKLRERFISCPNVIIYENALADSYQTKEFYVTENQVSSSLRKPLEMEAIKCEINTVRLDGMVNKVPDVLKLDVQGCEMEALIGCGAMLKGIPAIVLEAQFLKLYEHQATYSDIDIFLNANDHILFNIYEMFTRKNGRVSGLDALYIRKDLIV